MANEKNFENRVKKFLKDNNIFYVKYLGCAFTEAGIPDLLVCYKGRFIGIELKAENGRPTDLQLYKIKKIRESGGVGFVLYPHDFDTFKECIKVNNFDILVKKLD